MGLDLSIGGRRRSIAGISWREIGVPANDLYTLSVNRLDLKENDFYWKYGAKRLQGDAVADCVLKLLTSEK